MFEVLLPRISALIITRSSYTRSADAETLAEKARAIAPDLPVIIKPIRSEALSAAWALSPQIVIAGSIFLLGDMMSEPGLS